MPTAKSRINVVLDEDIYRLITELSKMKGVSKSRIARELMTEALELTEDIELAKIADERLKTHDPNKTYTHEEAWSGISS